MRAKTIFIAAIALAGCSTVKLSQVDHCTVQRSKAWNGAVRDEIVFCEREAPKWSEDRALRLTQECLYEADMHRRDTLILSARAGHITSLPDEDAFAKCYPDTVKTVQAENDALKERIKHNDEIHTQLDAQREKFTATNEEQRKEFEGEITGERSKLETQLDGQRAKLEAQLDSQREKLEAQLDSQRNKLDDQRNKLDDSRERLEARMDEQRTKLETQMEGQHERLETQLVAQHGELDQAMAGQNGKLEETLSKALDRPINAVAEAHSTSGADSDTNVKHNSDSKEQAHFDYTSSMPQLQQPPPVTVPRRVRHDVAKPVIDHVSDHSGAAKECVVKIEAETKAPAAPVPSVLTVPGHN